MPWASHFTSALRVQMALLWGVLNEIAQVKKLNPPASCWLNVSYHCYCCYFNRSIYWLFCILSLQYTKMKEKLSFCISNRNKINQKYKHETHSLRREKPICFSIHFYCYMDFENTLTVSWLVLFVWVWFCY